MLPVLGDVVAERDRLEPVLRAAPATRAAVRHVVRDLGLLQHLPDELRAEPVGVSSKLAGGTPGLKGLEGDVELVVVPDVTAEQRERHTLGVELGLHGPVLLPLRSHASVTVTHIDFYSFGVLPLIDISIIHQEADFCTRFMKFSKDLVTFLTT